MLYKSYLISYFNCDLWVMFIIYSKRCDTENGVYRMFFLGQNFVSGLICRLKNKKKPKKPQTFSQQPRYFPALVSYVL